MTTHTTQGQALVRDLIEYIRSGTEMPEESKETWIAALVGLILAGNKDEVGQVLTEKLDLQFKRGAPNRDTEINVFRIEMFYLAGQSKTKTFDFLADGTGRDSSTIRDAYYRFRKKYPNRYRAIQDVAKLQHENRAEEGGGMVSEDFLGLSLALYQRNLS